MRLSVRGFTLVELLVVISIMAIIGVMAVANYSSLKVDQDIKSAASDLQTQIRLAQANSTARIKCNNDDTGSGADWIVALEQDQVTVDLQCQIVQTPPPSPTPTPIPTTTQLVFANGIKIDSITVDACNVNFPGSASSIRYSPLYGNVSFSAPPCTGNKMSINLKDLAGNIKIVTVSTGGAVGIQ